MIPITQGPKDWYKVVTGNDDCTIENIELNQGGLVKFLSSGRLVVNNCFSHGAPHGSGNYYILVATGGALSVTLDNSDLHNCWLFSGEEANSRFMGRARRVTVTNYDFCCRMHRVHNGKDDLLAIPTIDKKGLLVHPGTVGTNGCDWWKQSLQWRDVDEVEWIGGRIVGPYEVGQSGNAKQPMKIGGLSLRGVGCTHDMKFSAFPDSCGLITRKDCYVIDSSGKSKRKGGLLMMWPDKRWWHGRAA